MSANVLPWLVGTAPIELVEAVLDVLKYAPGVAAALFTIYFASRKIGHKIEATYTTIGGRGVIGVGSVTLVNCKDTPVVVFALCAVVRDEVRPLPLRLFALRRKRGAKRFFVTLKEFDPPLILKPLEAHAESIDRVTAYIDGGKRHVGRFTGQNLDIYVQLRASMKRCVLVGAPKLSTLTAFPKLRRLSEYRFLIGDRAITQHTLYSLHYGSADKPRAITIMDDGVVGGDVDGFFPTMFRKSEVESLDALHDAIHRREIKRNLGSYSLERLGEMEALRSMPTNEEDLKLPPIPDEE